MKKYVLLAIILDLFIICMSYSAFKNNFSGEESQKIAEISKLVFQATVTGAVTFSGLFLTICSQDNQVTKKERMELCACMVIKDSHGTSASKEISSISNNKNVVICSNEGLVRTVECTIENCKNNYALNLSIKSINGEIKLGTIKDNHINLQLALKEGNKGIFVFKFEDIYGLKYMQEISYEYQQTTNEFQFISHQPKRRLS